MMKKMLLLLVFWGCTLSSAWALDMNTQQNSTFPSYQFQSTSTCSSAVGNSTFVSTTVYAPCSSAPSSKPRRLRSEYNPWDEDGDGNVDSGDPTGYGIGNVNTPVGEPLVLLLLAMIYLFRCFYRKRIMDDGQWTMDNR